ncbi:hypothetical protein ACTIVE_8889 [Actinomadura verrucosospora]|uniref:Uncharacterized protein n=1 Tax=Actinomadura verrucosospora TaxID=46165 RepID=A0A7D3W6K4_ACTVE|nr:hypothetical protein ACTIVE_8889 [Actinomadura verrucosospora]
MFTDEESEVRSRGSPEVFGAVL